MINRYYIPYFLILLFIFVFKGNTNAQYQVQLFPDRNFCVSGDTLWFRTIIIPGNKEAASNIVHVQLDRTGNRHITKVSVLCEDNSGQGYLQVPDSLPTGVYLLKAFTCDSKNDSQCRICQRLLMVYNRFDHGISQISMPPVSHARHFERTEEIRISTDKDRFKTREQVNVKIKIPAEKCSDLSALIITAGVADPFAEEFNAFCIPVSQNVDHVPAMSLIEKNGILVNGKVFSSKDNAPASGAVVLLSIPDTIPYFDYCISDSLGMFYFYLRNVVGTGNLVIQARKRSSPGFSIKLLENYMETEENFNMEEKFFSDDQKSFAETVIEASYFNKLFTGYPLPSPNTFSRQVDFDFPFYGKPTTTVYPELFIDLPDFTEISRELLHGVQYREKKDGTTIRMYNYGGEEVFNEEPLTLLDGIPVFDPGTFSKMGTRDIKKVDEVFYERFFGDLSFKGVLAVYSKKQSLSWIESSPNVELFNYSCLQASVDWTFQNGPKVRSNIPDFRNVYYRENIKEIFPQKEFNFFTSDLKGRIAIRVIAITKQNQILYTSKLIEIQ